MILRDQLAADGPGLPSKDPALFLRLMLDYCLQCIDESQLSRSHCAFFDRGIPDIIAYAARFGVNHEPFTAAARLHRYETCVFVLPPWQDIFVPDDLRRMTFKEYVAFHDLIVTAYEESGYHLIQVPFASVEDRADFVLNESRTQLT